MQGIDQLGRQAAAALAWETTDGWHSLPQPRANTHSTSNGGSTPAVKKPGTLNGKVSSCRQGLQVCDKPAGLVDSCSVILSPASRTGIQTARGLPAFVK